MVETPVVGLETPMGVWGVVETPVVVRGVVEIPMLGSVGCWRPQRWVGGDGGPNGGVGDPNVGVCGAVETPVVG